VQTTDYTKKELAKLGIVQDRRKECVRSRSVEGRYVLHEMRGCAEGKELPDPDLLVKELSATGDLEYRLNISGHSIAVAEACTSLRSKGCIESSLN